VLAASIIRAMISLVMEAASTSEMLENFYQTTRCNNPEGSHLHRHSVIATQNYQDVEVQQHLVGR
jgi:dipeptidase